jgi:hypothetical protein
MLAKDATQRYQTPAEVVNALAPFASANAPTLPKEKPAPRTTRAGHHTGPRRRAVALDRDALPLLPDENSDLAPLAGHQLAMPAMQQLLHGGVRAGQDHVNENN